MSSDGSPGANDNGNTELPTLSTTNSDNDLFFLTSGGGGNLLGDAVLPSRFLSAKNSIEIHKNKILPNNQSLPSVLKDRGHCLHNLVSTNQESTAHPLRPIFSPIKLEHGHSHAEPSGKHSCGSKSSKAVNWAPNLSGQNNSLSLKCMDNTVSSQSSNANLHVLPGISVTNETNHCNDKAEDDDGRLTCNCIEIGLRNVEDGNDSPCVDGTLVNNHEQARETSMVNLPLQRLHNEVSFPTSNISPHGGSPTCIPIHHAIATESIINITGGSECNTGHCEAPVLRQTSVSEYTLISQSCDDNYKSSCLFIPPVDNYVYNAQLRMNPSEEFNRETCKLMQNYPVARRDQNTGPDNTLPLKDNNLDNHNISSNYDTDDDLGDPDPQASVLTLANPKDLPVPDAEFVSRMVPEELHPFIAKTCKKDCRTWLWKSNSQREAVVTQQRKVEGADGTNNFKMP